MYDSYVDLDKTIMILNIVPYCTTPESVKYGEVVINNNKFISTINWVFATDAAIHYEGSMNFTMIGNYLNYYQKATSAPLVRYAPGLSGRCNPAGVYSVCNLKNNTFSSPDISPNAAEGYQIVFFASTNTRVVDLFIHDNIVWDFVNGIGTASRLTTFFAASLTRAEVKNTKYLNLTCETVATTYMISSTSFMENNYFENVKTAEIENVVGLSINASYKNIDMRNWPNKKSSLVAFWASSGAFGGTFRNPVFENIILDKSVLIQSYAVLNVSITLENPVFWNITVHSSESLITA